MSREIKFRVWDDVIHGWHAAKAIDEFTDNYPKENNFNSVGFRNSKKVFIEQYTGLTDKNGKEIYEGDIIEEEIDFNSKMTDGTFRYKVYWNKDELCWSLDPIGPESIHNDLWELNSSCRVIGNVHEPPKDFRPEHLKRMGVSICKGGEE